MNIINFGSITLSITSVTFFVFCVFAIAVLGYVLGSIKIKGVSLGTAGVFIIALFFGCLFYSHLSQQLVISGTSYIKNALKIVESIGLMLFVSSVGFIAGPNFISNFKKNFKSYILLGVVIILTGAIVCIVCINIQSRFSTLPQEELTAMFAGLFSGSLTSTPAFSAAKETVTNDELEAIVAVGNGIAYLFGVVGVVLFVQIVPKIMNVDMEEQKKLLETIKVEKKNTTGGKILNLDSFGILPFSLAVCIGVIVGSVKFGAFSLTTTGGCLLVSILLGHYGKIGIVNIMPKETTLKVLRELGLMFFLIGAGVSGGASFVTYFEPIYFAYGMVITLVPMVVGFLFAKKVLKMGLLNNLGSITGGMTSTPALGTLISVAKTENVAAAYAATYPVALISVVIATQIIIVLY